MKKNLILSFSLLLILTMLLSMYYAASTNKNEEIDLSDKGEKLTHDLRINIRKEPLTLHPGLANDPISETILLQTFEGLTRIDQWGQIINASAEVIKISDDQKTYTFTLREAKWSNGDPVIAKDFEYAWKWSLDPKNNSSNAHLLFYIEGAQAYNEGKGSVNDVGVKAVDNRTLEVKLVNPTPYFLELTASNTYFPINSKIAEKNPDWAKEASNQLTTNGAFELTQWFHNEKILLRKNKEYWDAGAVQLKSITMFMENDPNKELYMFESGIIDWAGSPMGYLPMERIEEFEYIDILNAKSINGIYSYKVNTTLEPFNNENIRKALAFAINRNNIVTNVTKAGQNPAMSIIPPAMWNDKVVDYFSDNNVAQAKQFLQKGISELGYNNVSDLPPINLSVNTDDTFDINIAKAIQKMWEENLGLVVQIDFQEWQTLNEKVQSLNYQIALMEWLSDYNDPISFLEIYKDPKNINNGTGWEDSEFKELLEQAQKEVNIPKRQSLLLKAESRMMEKMPVIPIFFYTNYWVQKDNLMNVAMSDLGKVQFKWSYFE